MNLFFQIYRNIYLQKKILALNKKTGKDLFVSVGYLNRNFKYLENQRDYDSIWLHLNLDNIDEYILSPHRNLVTNLNVYLTIYSCEDESIREKFRKVIAENKNLVYLCEAFPKSCFIDGSGTLLELPNNIESYKGYSLQVARNIKNLKEFSLTLNTDTDSSLSLPKNLKCMKITGDMHSQSENSLVDNCKNKLVYNYQGIDKLLLPRNSLNNIYSLDLTYVTLSKPLQIGDLPNGLKILLFKYTYALQEHLLPNSITKLKIVSFNHPFSKQMLPTSLTSLHMESFNQTLCPFIFNSCLKKLYLNSYYGVIIKHSLPYGLEHLTMGSLNCSLEHFPPTITSLYLSYRTYFNKELPQLYLPNLRILDIFNNVTPIDISIFSSKTSYFKSLNQLSVFIHDEQIDLSMLTNVTVLDIDSKISNTSNFKLPPNLVDLTLSFSIKSFHSELFPKSLKSLKIKNTRCGLTPTKENEYFPSGLKSLYLYSMNSNFIIPKSTDLYISSVIQ
ncbi:hypothetical protein CYY_005569 [Polysphondylium violaceum]|uniref:FNIP repeat-containing protein n=1 Tax=Polysphondylium violaceum TaxID=133409 RepID=A0A8J4PRP1_9MYCE|nr:hypothetical protein CYY_005569 [Polysphondylium violaceum]